MHQWPRDDDDPQEGQEWVWLWPLIFAGLVIVDIWLVDLGLWWFGWWPPG